MYKGRSMDRQELVLFPYLGRLVTIRGGLYRCIVHPRTVKHTPRKFYRYIRTRIALGKTARFLAYRSLWIV